MNRQRLLVTVFGGGPSFLIRDEFSEFVTAGSVNGTAATPGPDTRVAVDTNSKIAVAAEGVLNFATGAAANDGVWYSLITRQAGRTLIIKSTPSSTAAHMQAAGFDTNQSGAGNDEVRFASGGTIQLLASGIGIAAGVFTAVTYTVALVMRAAGIHFFIKGGAFTNWTYLYPHKTGTANQYPVIQAISTAGVFTADYLRIPRPLITIQPVASDDFGSTWGSTAGGGSEESGGAGLTWTAQKGTWGSATGVASCSALTDSLGIATVPCATPNVIVEVIATRSAGNAGLMLRYTDINNYIHASHNGTNLQVVEVVSGTPNTLINTAATYGATKRIVVSLNGTAVRAYYGEALVNTATTAVTTGNVHGLYTDDTGATFDSFVVWTLGNGGEYEGTFNKYANP